MIPKFTEQLCHDHLLIKGASFLRWDEVKTFANCVSNLKKQSPKFKELEKVPEMFLIRASPNHLNLLNKIFKACPLPVQENQTTILESLARFIDDFSH
mgnify:FL=1